jgi:uncharacterized membrane protein
MPATAQTLRANSSTLGALWLLYGILRLVAAILLLLFTPTATVMFGALLTRVPDPYTLMTAFHILYIAAITVTLLSGLFALLAGASLVAARPAARTFALLAAFFSLHDLPLGTTLGVYTLIVFLL